MRFFSILRGRHECSCVSARGSKKGSALLIVLGFLGFMVISGVSFAVYMRIEHQAAANYRHSVTARHLLNSGLVRAMEEIDSELRIMNDKKVKWLADNEQSADNNKVQVKFPQWKDWPGRVKASAVADHTRNDEDARVLSLEALSYLPAVLVNDVRRFAVNRQYGSKKDKDYMGAKWRPLDRSIDGTMVGRYAYVCVNVSDMLNVNECRASLPRSSTNLVSLGHLFDSFADRKNFDENAAKDRFYFSLQDFYAARYERSKTAKSSPYHKYVNDTGGGASGLYTFNDPSTELHTFITDGLAKAEQAGGGGCNILLNQPLNEAVLDIARPAPNVVKFNGTFLNRLKEVPADDSLKGNGIDDAWANIVKDYLDEDGVVCSLALPSVEMAPMISQVVMNPSLMFAELQAETVPAVAPPTGAGKAGKKCTLRLINGARLNDSGGAFPISVEVVFPFKYFEKKLQLRNPAFKIYGKWVFSLVNHAAPKATQVATEGDLPTSFTWESEELAMGNVFPASEDAARNNPETACYKKFPLFFKPFDNVSKNEIPVWDFDPIKGEDIKPYGDGKDIRVASSFWLEIFDGTRDKIVDRIPCWADIASVPPAEVEEFWRSGPKLYFRTETLQAAIPAVAATGLAAVPDGDHPLNYVDWNSLEVPDPRFNHKPSNWIASLVPTTEADGEMNKSTKDLLADNSGRDADIFMSVSDAGYMQSPGELGFIVRPYATFSRAGDVDFSGQQSIADMKRDKGTTDSDVDAMFRTFRLYDHGGNNPQQQRRDFIYNNFYAANADGTLPGARANPLSDLLRMEDNSALPTVLEAAILDTPLDYFFASTNYPSSLAWNSGEQTKSTLDRRYFHSDQGATATGWKRFVNGWAEALTNAVRKPVSGQVQRGGNTYTFRVDRDWRSNLSDVYGAWDVFEWYQPNTGSSGDGKEIFGNVNMTDPLHEIDRKMFYSFSLDAFSDRQQLFLYFIRAEAVMPALGAGGGGVRSLAGGRAVALVWRDPYPRGYNKVNAAGAQNESSTSGAAWDTKMGNTGSWYPERDDYLSPWRQYYNETEKVANMLHAQDDPRASGGYRWNGWHDTRVLFFRQLDK